MVRGLHGAGKHRVRRETDQAHAYQQNGHDHNRCDQKGRQKVPQFPKHCVPRALHGLIAPRAMENKTADAARPSGATEPHHAIRLRSTAARYS